MKGDIDSITQATIVIIICIAIIAIAPFSLLFAYARGGGQITHEYELIGIFNKPYSLAEALSSYKPNDRSFIENALEAGVTGSLAKAQSQNIQAPVKNFLEFFGLRSYQVKISKDELDLFTVNNFAVPCGNGKGMCTSSLGRKINVCGEGRQQLPDSSSCSSDMVCCSIEIRDAIKCGSNSEGICTSVKIDNTEVFALLPCGEGREQINDAGKCVAAHVCCKYLDARDIGLTSKAELPLIYKGEKVGDVKVETSAR